MAYSDSDDRVGTDPTHSTAAQAPAAVKILIAGGFGVGKTTMVGAVSEVVPLNTEEHLTAAGIGVDDIDGVDQKATTTVALDFGRITVNSQLVLYLFGTPGQERFWFMWNDLVHGALGAVVLVDTRRLKSSFASIDFFESRGIPFVVGVNCFDGRRDRTESEVRGTRPRPAHPHRHGRPPAAPGKPRPVADPDRASDVRPGAGPRRRGRPAGLNCGFQRPGAPLQGLKPG